MNVINPIRQKVYKVVHRDPETSKLHSVLRELRNTTLGLEYEPNFLIRPKIGKIFAFTSLEAARSFSLRQSFDEIWEAEAYGGELAAYRCKLVESNKLEKLVEYFWTKFHHLSPAEQRITYCNRLEILSADVGVLLCKSIKLIKKV